MQRRPKEVSIVSSVGETKGMRPRMKKGKKPTQEPEFPEKKTSAKCMLRLCIRCKAGMTNRDWEAIFLGMVRNRFVFPDSVEGTEGPRRPLLVGADGTNSLSRDTGGTGDPFDPQLIIPLAHQVGTGGPGHSAGSGSSHGQSCGREGRSSGNT